jgi:hypothetical protein
MPHFKAIKPGTSEVLLNQTKLRIEQYLKEIFEEGEVIQVDDLYTFSFGSVTINIRVLPWHSEDVLVDVFSYVAENITLSQELAQELLHLNYTLHFGAFGLSLDSIVFSYSLAGANLDFNEFLAAVQTVATVADEYDEQIKAAAAGVAV